MVRGWWFLLVALEACSLALSLSGGPDFTFPGRLGPRRTLVTSTTPGVTAMTEGAPLSTRLATEQEAPVTSPEETDFNEVRRVRHSKINRD